MTLSLSGGLHLDGARSSSSSASLRGAQGQSQSDFAAAHLDRSGGHQICFKIMLMLLIPFLHKSNLQFCNLNVFAFCKLIFPDERMIIESFNSNVKTFCVRRESDGHHTLPDGV